MPWTTSDRGSRLPKDWEQIREAVLKRDGYECQLKIESVCFGEATEVDHKMRGDDHRRSNLQAACTYCHAKKSSKEGNEVQARMRAQRRRPPERHPGRR